jgi:hypothetical protein
LQNRDIPSVTFSGGDDDADADDEDDNGASMDEVSFTAVPHKTRIANAILI